MRHFQKTPSLVLSAALFGCLCSLPAQTLVPFDFAVEQDGSFTPISTASTLTLQAPQVGQSIGIRLRIRNTRTTPVTLQSAAVVGSRFTLEPPPLPIVLESGAGISVGISYTAAGSLRVSGELLVSYVDAPGAARQTISLSLAGVAPEFRTSYIVGADGNATLLSNGGSVIFPDTLVNSSATATVAVVNVGSGPGTVNEATVQGTAFRTQGLPVFPVVLPANTELRFGVRFTPPQIGAASGGSLALKYSTGDLNATLEGNGIASAFSYELELPSGVIPLRPGERVTLPSAPIGTTVNYSVRVANNGNSTGSITAISVLGAAFSLSETPTLPASVLPQSSILFLLNVTPREAGNSTGRLRIGNDSFDFAVSGTGSQFRYSYVLSGVSVSIEPLATIPFPATRVGENSQVQFSIRNTGNLDAVIPNLSVSSGTASYSLVNAPAVPIQLAPDQSVTVGMVFSPTGLSPETGVLTVGTVTFPLTGTGTPPPALPAYSISGVSGTVQQLEQPVIGLSLANPYPVLLRGQLRLIFEPSNFADDTSIQFSTGGRTVEFTIPAGSTDAVFSNGSNRIRFQTGTVAGNIVLSPSFSVGTLPLSADSVLRVTLPASPPRLLTLQVLALTSSSVTFLITGSTPTRELDSIAFDFQPAAGSPASLTLSTVNVNVRALADNYFRSSLSAGLGGLFQATVPFTLSLGGSAIPNLAQIVSGVSVTLANAQGKSSSLTVPLL